MNVFRVDPSRDRESRPRNPLTTSRRTSPLDSGVGRGSPSAYPASSAASQHPITPPGGGGDARNGQVYAAGMPAFGPWLGRAWQVEVFSNNQHVAQIPIACPANQLPIFVCPCGVQVRITLDMNDMHLQPPVHFVWIYAAGQGQRWNSTSAYDGRVSLGSCPICYSQFQLLGPCQ